MNRIAQTVGLLLLTACTPPGERPDTLPAPAAGMDPGARGVVRIVGSAPVNVQVVLQPASGGAIRLTGPLRGELERLAGVEVEVRGRVSPSPDPMADRQLEATGYSIVAVDGRPAVLGEVIEVAGEWARLRTEAGEEIYLSSPPSSFRAGQKVWVQGPSSMAVQSYGILRP